MAKNAKPHKTVRRPDVYETLTGKLLQEIDSGRMKTRKFSISELD
jgi:hypothetical protein